MYILKKFFVVFFAVSTLFLLSSCSEDDQMKVAEGQACLDKIPQSTPTLANDCLQFFQDVTGPQADALRCSIKFLAGGVTTNKIVDAATQIDEGANTEEIFLSILVFNGIDPSGGAATGAQALINVQEAVTFCNASGVEGLMFLANFAVAGTALIKQMDALFPGTVSDWADPQVTSATLNTGNLDSTVTNCQDPASQNCDEATVGAAILTLGDSYCNAGNEDDKLCQDVNAAIAAGSDPATVGNAFFDQLSK